MSKNNAIVIVSINRDEHLKHCLHGVTQYCKIHNIALEVITKARFNIGIHDGYNYGTFEKFQIYDCFDKYDNILRLDSDTIITPSCPNVFENDYEFAAVFEDKGTRKLNRFSQMELVQKSLGNVGFVEGYFNSGVILVNKKYRELFSITNINDILQLDLGCFKEQTLLNWKVQNAKIKVVDLGYKYNHMTMFSEEWNGNPDSRHSHIIHYAGSQQNKAKHMEADNNYFYNKRHKVSKKKMSVNGFIKLLKQNIPFAFSRFNDGEILAMYGQNGQLTARGDQTVNDSLRENLIRCAKHEQLNYWKGYPCENCFPEHCKLANELFGDYKHRCLATVFVNNNWRNFIKEFPKAIKDRNVIFVSGNDQNPSKLWFMPIITKLHITIPNKNSWDYYDEVVGNEEITQEFTKDAVVLLSCGPLSRVLACDWFQKYPNCTFIDLGSCLDPFTRNSWHRCHLGELPPCPECNNV